MCLLFVGDTDALCLVTAVRDVESALKLCALQDELEKLKAMVAFLYPVSAAEYRLGERLANA